jgi:predicted PurR-regulated permease PerM
MAGGYLNTQSGQLARYLKPLLILIGIAVVLWLFFISAPVIIPFLVGILLAYLLMPLVTKLEKILPPRNKPRKWKRTVSVIIVFVVFSIILIVFLVYIGAALYTASGILINKAPGFISNSVNIAQDWWKVFKINLPENIDSTINSTLSGVGPAAGKFAQDFLAGSIAVVSSSMPTIIGIVTLPFFLIFLLIDYEKFGIYIRDIFPYKSAKHTSKILKIFANQMGRYLRYQIFLSLIVGFLITLGLLVLGQDYAPAMGVIAAFTQVIPIIGPFISAAIILVVALALKPDMLLWVLIVIVVAQIVVNLMQGWLQEKHFPLHPAVIMVLLAVGGFIASYWGLILALPVGATIWEIYKYFKNESEPKKTEENIIQIAES